MKIENALLMNTASGEPQVDNSRAQEYVKKGMNKDSGALKDPDILLIHYTGTLNVDSDIHTLYEPNTQVSVHFVIGLDGSIFQLMPLNKIAWHAGESSFQGRKGMNKYSIGIEIVNPGFLTQTADGRYLTWYNKPVDAGNALLLKHKQENTARYWHSYTEEQIDSVRQLCKTLIEVFPIKFVLGHDDVAPNRKCDPGPAFPLGKIQNLLLGDRKEEVDPVRKLKQYGEVSVEKLNIRQDADVNAAKIAMPLRQGQKVEILEEKNGWLKVETTIQGWVNATYIK